MSAIEAGTTISDLCSNFTNVAETKVVEKIVESTCESCSVGWYIVAIVVLVLGCVFLPDVARAELLKELRDIPSYELHNRLEALYKEKFSVKTESLLDFQRYPHVSHQDDRVTMKRTITIVEDLSWVSLPAVDPSSQERATTTSAATANTPAVHRPADISSVEHHPPTYTSNPDSSAPSLSTANSPVVAIQPASSTSTVEEEGARLLGPQTSAQQHSSRPGYTSVADDSESDIEHVEMPPAYSPTIQSINDSDSEVNRPAHP